MRRSILKPVHSAARRPHIRWGRGILAAIGFVLMASMMTAQAWAQQDQPKPAPKAEAPDPKAPPPTAAPPAPNGAAAAAVKAAEPPADAAAADTAPPATDSAEPATSEPNATDAVEDAESQLEEMESPDTREGLPEGFKPRDARPKSMEFTKELITEEREAELKKELEIAHYKTVLRSGSLNNQVRDILKKTAEYDVYRMSMEKYHQRIDTIREELFSNISAAAQLNKNAADREQFRRVYLQEVVNRAVELLDGNYHVRINAAITLMGMNLVEGGRNTPTIPFDQTFKPLLDIVRSESQPDAVKLVAVNGLNRLSLAGILSTTDRIDTATALINEIKRPNTHYFYQERLVLALSRIDLTLDRDNRAFIVQMLTEAVADTGRHWLVRSEAAKGLGRAKWDRRINIKKLVYEVVHLAREMVEAFNKEPTAYYWPDCFFDVYLAFQPLDTVERQLGFGFRTREPTNGFVESSYRLIVPLTNHITMKKSRQPIDAQQIVNLDDWLKKNTPDDHSVAPNLPPIVTKQAEETARTGPPR